MRGAAAIAVVMALAQAAGAAPPKVRAISVNISGSDLIVTLDRGTDDGVALGWRAHCQVGKASVDGAIIRVTRHTSVTKLGHVTIDVFPSTITCELSPPPSGVP